MLNKYIDNPEYDLENSFVLGDNPATTEVDEARSYFRLDVGNAYDMHFTATAFGFDLFGADHLDKTSANLGSTEMIDALTWLNGTLRPAINDYAAGTLDGESKVDIKAGTQSGTVIPIKNRGVTKLRSSHRGELFVHVEVVIPAKLNKAEEELMRNFANSRGDSAESAKVDNRENGLFGRLKDALGR